jgi:hypothetical protein
VPRAFVVLRLGVHVVRLEALRVVVRVVVAVLVDVQPGPPVVVDGDVRGVLVLAPDPPVEVLRVLHGGLPGRDARGGLGPAAAEIAVAVARRATPRVHQGQVAERAVA